VTESAGRAARAQPERRRRDRGDAVALFEEARDQGDRQEPQKKPWSVFRKMEAKALSFEQLSDIFGFRVARRHG
jgi:hypothetical protein